MFIRTERLFLRPAWPEDMDDIVEALRGNAVARTLAQPGLPRTVSEIRALLESERSLRLPQFMMYLRAPGGPRLVGGIGLVESDEDVELVYWITPAFSGRGFAGEAVRAILDQARSLGHTRIVAWQPVLRDADARVLLAAGFEDTYRVEERFSPGDGEVLPACRFEASLVRRAVSMPHPAQYAESLSA